MSKKVIALNEICYIQQKLLDLPHTDTFLHQ